MMMSADPRRAADALRQHPLIEQMKSDDAVNTLMRIPKLDAARNDHIRLWDMIRVYWVNHARYSSGNIVEDWELGVIGRLRDRRYVAFGVHYVVEARERPMKVVLACLPARTIAHPCVCALDISLFLGALSKEPVVTTYGLPLETLRQMLEEDKYNLEGME